LTHGNIFSIGARNPFDLFWSEGTYDWSVVAGTDTPDEAVNIARSRYCRA
jgi:hypothetical protein